MTKLQIAQSITTAEMFVVERVNKIQVDMVSKSLGTCVYHTQEGRGPISRHTVTFTIADDTLTVEERKSEFVKKIVKAVAA